ncbi:hypothetical protein GIB67_017536 [Kingdonia uniflora]|uniref:Uncharacterized protein n=1 Tax=Kingdonia uniflora TaxID=39325 RepID=A0A7J7M4K9_9MAGN|nr:hypothetical protein GIB67_017536 [Kingdonia uniflora]
MPCFLHFMKDFITLCNVVCLVPYRFTESSHDCTVMISVYDPHFCMSWVAHCSSITANFDLGSGSVHLQLLMMLVLLGLHCTLSSFTTFKSCTVLFIGLFESVTVFDMSLRMLCLTAGMLGFLS